MNEVTIQQRLRFSYTPEPLRRPDEVVQERVESLMKEKGTSGFFAMQEATNQVLAEDLALAERYHEYFQEDHYS